MAGSLEEGKSWFMHGYGMQGFVKISLLSILTVWINLVSQSYGQPGFLNIVCGVPSFSDIRGLSYVSDINSTFILTGKSSMDISVTTSSFRFFPERRNKYCYELPTKNDTIYLIRAVFDPPSGLVLPIKFVVYFNATNVFTMTYSASDNQSSTSVSSYEGLFYSPGAVLYICLQPLIGTPFITYLVLREIDPPMYSFQGSDRQYLALLLRENLGADPSITPNPIRYPDDSYDRLWNTPQSSWYNLFRILKTTTPPDAKPRPEANNVPPKVMEDAWAGYPFWVSFPLFPTPPLSMTPPDYAYVVVYAEQLNSSSSGGTMTIELDGIRSPDVNVSDKASISVSMNFILSSTSLNFSVKAAIDSEVSLNAGEVFAQYDFNFSKTSPTDDAAITTLKQSFSLNDWQGDPCTPVPHDWLSCGDSFNNLAQTLQLPCSSASTDQCTARPGFLRRTYYVTSLSLTSMPTKDFSTLQNNIANSPGIKLNNLQEMHITGSAVNLSAFKFLINDFAGGVLTVLDFTNNSIENFPLESDWAGLMNLVSLNLSQNLLAGELSPFENVSFFNSLRELNLSHNAMSYLPSTWQNTTNSLVVLDLSQNNLVGDISALDPLVKINSNSLQELDVSYNSLAGTFPSNFYFSTALSILTFANFEGNNINGTLDLSVWLEALEKNPVQASQKFFSFVNNRISDIVPNAAALEPTIKRLQAQNIDLNRSILALELSNSSANLLLQHTDAVGSRPQSWALVGLSPQGRTCFDSSFGFKWSDSKLQIDSRLGGNPYCNRMTSDIQRFFCRTTITEDYSSSRSNHNKDIMIIGICVGVAALLLSIITIATLWKFWKQVYALRAIQQALADQKVQPPFYRYSDLKSATRDFHKDNKLGHGGFGEVYMGVLVDRTSVAVKRLFNSQKEHVLNEFLNEVVLITGIKHRNLVHLKGCCIREQQRILVFEYVEKGNLAQALWGSRPHGSLDWTQRFQICVGVARGLSYLHEELQPSIIHRDVKPENILLDKNYKPKIADFGLARNVLDESRESLYTKPAGTLGYFAPEYATQGQLSDKVDVYSYGIVLLEIVCGRKCIDHTCPPEAVFLKEWVHKMHNKGLLFDALEPALKENCVEHEVLRALSVGLQCVQHDPEMRPSMSQVVLMLMGNMDVEVSLEESEDTGSQHKHLLGTTEDTIEYPAPETTVEDPSGGYPLLEIGLESSHGSSSGSQRPKSFLQMSPWLGDSLL